MVTLLSLTILRSSYHPVPGSSDSRSKKAYGSFSAFDWSVSLNAINPIRAIEKIYKNQKPESGHMETKLYL